MPEGIAVPLWPAVAAFGDCRLTALATPDSPQRTTARQIVRTALSDLLGEHFACPRATLIDRPGLPPRLREAPFAIAISHEAGLSLLAVQPAGRLGIDLLRRDAVPPSAAERRRLAEDYFGNVAPAVVTDPLAFARAWTAHEARLKCLGVPLGEWSPQHCKDLPGLSSAELQLPAPYIGTLAWAAPYPASEPADSPV